MYGFTKIPQPKSWIHTASCHQPLRRMTSYMSQLAIMACQSLEVWTCFHIIQVRCSVNKKANGSIVHGCLLIPKDVRSVLFGSLTSLFNHPEINISWEFDHSWVIHSYVVNDKIDILLLFWSDSESFGKWCLEKCKKTFDATILMPAKSVPKFYFITYLCELEQNRKFNFFTFFKNKIEFCCVNTLPT